MTPTDDDIIQFAAEQLGLMDQAVYPHVEHYSNQWWFWETLEIKILARPSTWKPPFDPLTSWEWLWKGLKSWLDQRGLFEIVAGNSLPKRKFPAEIALWDFQGRKASEGFIAVAQLPRAFWLCWWRLAQEGEEKNG